jgi:3-oxoacyl-[acyl-carrier protein] reductase
MGKLDGKVAIVTGAARGLGRAYARRLASLGAKVAVSDLNLRSYEEFEGEAQAMTADSTVDEIKAGGGDALGFEFDIGERETVFAMVEAVTQAWGRWTSWWPTPVADAASPGRPPRRWCRRICSSWSRG